MAEEALVLAQGDSVPGSVATTAYRVDQEWDLQSGARTHERTTPMSAATPAEFKDALYQAFLGVNEAHGGPMQFLQHRYKTQKDLEGYVKELWNRFPAEEAAHIGNDLQSWPEEKRDEAKVYKLHLTSLDFREQCTDREMPSEATAKSSR